MILKTIFHSIITLPQGFYLNIQEHLFLPKTASLSPKASSISFPTAGFKGIHGLSKFFPTWSIDHIEISLYAPTHHWMAISTESQYLTWPYVTAVGATQTILDRNGSSIQLLFFRFSQTMRKCSEFDLTQQLQGLIQAQMVNAKKLFWRRAIALNQWQFQSVWCTNRKQWCRENAFLAFDEVMGQGCQMSCTRKSCPCPCDFNMPTWHTEVKCTYTYTFTCQQSLHVKQPLFFLWFQYSLIFSRNATIV